MGYREFHQGGAKSTADDDKKSWDIKEYQGIWAQKYRRRDNTWRSKKTN